MPGLQTAQSRLCRISQSARKMIPHILYEDDDILVVDKPAGLLVHAAPGHEGESTVADFLVKHCPNAHTVGSVSRPGIVHRLDQETSGVMVLAKTQSAYLDLRRQFERHETVVKTYLAVCHGALKPAKGTLDELIDGQYAVSHYEVLGRKGSIALVEFRIETGRQHQIRIHAKKAGCPLVGDALYGDAERDRHLRIKPKRLLLHAVELSFLHPKTHRRVTFAAPPPADIVYSV